MAGYGCLTRDAAPSANPLPLPAPPLQRLASLPLPKLVPTGFVFIWTPKQHVQAVCKQARQARASPSWVIYCHAMPCYAP